MKTLWFLLFVLLMVLYSCDYPVIFENQGNFLDQMHVGQKIRYVYFWGEDYKTDLNYAFTYFKDTLELTVLETRVNSVLISEHITDGSYMITHNSDYYWGKENVYMNYWTIRHDSLILKTDEKFVRSHLLYRNNLSLQDFDAEEVQIIGWRITIPYSQIGEDDHKYIVKDYSLLGHFYTRLNIFVNNRPMKADGYGVTTFYSKRYGIVRTCYYGPIGGDGNGWDRL